MIIAPDWTNHVFLVCGTAKIIGIPSGLWLLHQLSQNTILARKGDQNAARSVILPSFEPLIKILIIGLFCEIVLLLVQPLYPSLIQIIIWMLYEWLRDGFTVIFLQTSLSVEAMSRAFKYSLLWLIHGLVCGCFLMLPDNCELSDPTCVSTTGIVTIVFYLSNACFYFLIISNVIPHRQSVHRYAIFMCAYRLVWCVYNVYALGVVSEPTALVEDVILAFLFLFEVPLAFVWYYILWKDTYYWRTGCGDSEVDYPLGKGLRILDDTSDSLIANDLQRFIEKNRSALIDFAYLEISNNLIGKGAFSRVYCGYFKGQRVAVKFFLKLKEVTPAAIALYSREIFIGSKLVHPNIIKFHGVCVRPPAIFIVMELAGHSPRQISIACLPFSLSLSLFTSILSSILLSC
jgi:hypothetical protein